MGKTTGFLEWKREAPPKRPRSERIHDAREFILPQAEQTGDRPAAAWTAASPSVTRAARWGTSSPTSTITSGAGAGRRPGPCSPPPTTFPSSPGGSARRRARQPASWPSTRRRSPSRQIEKEIVDRAFPRAGSVRGPRRRAPGRRWRWWAAGRRGWPPPRSSTAPDTRSPSSSGRPRRAGCCASAFPDFKLEKSVIDRRVALLEAEGVTFRCGVDVGTAPGFDQLASTDDAGAGARRPAATRSRRPRA